MTTFTKVTSLLLSLFFAVCFSATAQTSKEKTQIVEQALSIPELRKYYKLKEKPERKELHILDNGKLLNTLPVTFAGTKVTFGKRGQVSENYVEFTEAEFKPATAQLTYLYPAEKISVDVKLVKKGNKWMKKSATVTPVK